MATWLRTASPSSLRCSVCGYQMSAEAVRSPDRIDHMRTHFTDINLVTGEVMRVDWCDVKGHAFKAGEPGSQQFTGVVVGEDGSTSQQTMSACGEHSFSVTAKAKDAPQLENGK